MLPQFTLSSAFSMGIVSTLAVRSVGSNEIIVPGAPCEEVNVNFPFPLSVTLHAVMKIKDDIGDRLSEEVVVVDLDYIV